MTTLGNDYMSADCSRNKSAGKQQVETHRLVLLEEHKVVTLLENPFSRDGHKLFREPGVRDRFVVLVLIISVGKLAAWDGKLEVGISRWVHTVGLIDCQFVKEVTRLSITVDAAWKGLREPV